MSIRKFILTQFLIFSSLLVYSFPIGEWSFIQFTKKQGLPSNEVYDIIEDKHGYIYAATNNGLVRYNGRFFKEIKTAQNEMPSCSFLRESSNGRLFTMTFDGRLFEVRKDTLRLIANLAGELRQYSSLYLSDDDQLWFCSNKNIYRFDCRLDKMDTIAFPDELNSEQNLNVSLVLYERNDTILIYNSSRELMLFNPKGEMIKEYEREPIGLFFSFRDKGENYIWNNYSENQDKIYRIDNDFELVVDSAKSVFAKKGTGIAFLSANGRNWYSTRSGLFVEDENSKVEQYFKDLVISRAIIDRDGQLWLSSTSQGIFLCKNLSLRRIQKGIRDSEIYSLGNTQDKLAIGFKNGEIQELRKNGDNFFYNASPANEIEDLKYYNKLLFAAASGVDIIDTDRNKMFHFSYCISKKIDFDSDGRLIVACNDKLTRFNLNPAFGRNNSIKLNEIIIPRSQEVISDSKPRTFCSRNDTLFYALNTRLYVRIDNKDSEITLKGKAIYANEIVYSNGEFWVGSNTGIHIFRNTSLEQSINIQSDLISNNVQGLLLKDSLIFAITNKGISVIEARSRKKRYDLDLSDGFNYREITDLAFIENRIFISTLSGLFVLDDDFNKINKNTPEIILKSISADGLMLDEDKAVILDYGFNKLEFSFDMIAQKAGDLAKMYYRWNQEQDFIPVKNEESSILLSGLSEGKYLFEVYAENEDGIRSEILTYPIKIRPPFVRTIWFYLILVTLTALVIVFIFQFRLRNLKNRLSLEKKIKSSELRAIQSQMNPHFVYNALNSIQDLVLIKDIRSSNRYLGRFSSLMRKVLKASESEAISLKEEIEILEIYLDLEKLRFGNDLKIRIEIRNISEEKQEQIRIPAMIIQPYVENAIKHGLLHKDGEKKLDILFEMTEDKLLCIIEDNGIGRKRSEEIKERQQGKSQGFATKANEKRIDLLNQVQKEKILLQITDLDTEEGRGGTIVKLYFPLLTHA